MLSLDFIKEIIPSQILLIPLSFVIGFVIYAVFPFVFAKICKTPIKKAIYKQICYGVGFVILVLSGIETVLPYVFWTWLSSSVGMNILEKKGILVDISGSSEERDAIRKAEVAAASLRARARAIRDEEREARAEARADAREARAADRREREERLAKKRENEAKLAKRREKEAKRAQLEKKRLEEEYEKLMAKEKRESDARREKKELDERRAQAKIGMREAKEAERAAKKAKKSNVPAGFCRKCGNILHDNGRYCKKCGERIVK